MKRFNDDRLFADVRTMSDNHRVRMRLYFGDADRLSSPDRYLPWASGFPSGVVMEVRVVLVFRSAFRIGID